MIKRNSAFSRITDSPDKPHQALKNLSTKSEKEI